MALNSNVFKKPPKQFEYYLTLNTEGNERTGKSNFMFTAPGEIGVIMLDRNTENVAIKAQKLGKSIKLADFTDPNPKTNPGLCMHAIQPMQAIKSDKSFYEKRWEKIKEIYSNFLEDPTIRTIALDTGTQIYEDIRLARFGKLTQVMPIHYGPVNSELREMILAAKGKNLIVTHKLGKEYKNDKWDGKSFESKGWSDMRFNTQITLRHSCEMVADDDGVRHPQFKITIEDCNQDPTLKGLELTDDECTFANLAQLVYPDADSDIWS